MHDLQSENDLEPGGNQANPDGQVERKALDAIESILEVTSDFMYVEDVDILLNKIVKTVSKTFGLAKTHIGIRSKETGLFEVRACYGYDEATEAALKKVRYSRERMEGDLRLEFRIGRNTYYVPAEGYSLEPQEILFVARPERMDKPRKLPDDWHELDYIDFVMYERDGNILGYLEIDEPLDNKVPDLEILKAIEVFSDLAAIAIQNAELYEQEARDRKDIELLIDLIGHDVNNYAQAVSGYIELAMQTADLCEPARKCMVKAHDQVFSLNNLISKVKLYAQVETSGTENMRPMDVVEALMQGFEDAKSSFHLKQVRLDMRHDGAPKLCEMNDLGKEIFLNIFSNAIKFDSHDEVVIEVSIEECRLDGREAWCVSIADHGPGIPDELKDSVFDRFTKSRRSSIGTGLGLHIAKTLVGNYKGRVWVEDRERGRHSQGSVFKIALPKSAPQDGVTWDRARPERGL